MSKFHPVIINSAGQQKVSVIMHSINKFRKKKYIKGCHVLHVRGHLSYSMNVSSIGVIVPVLAWILV